MSKATIDDVAKLAGVSIKTVSRVVNNEANVRDATRARVQHAIETLNYSPNQSARSLASRRSYLIGLLYDDPSLYEIPSSSYVISIQEGVLKACKSRKYDLLIHPCFYRDRHIANEIRTLIEHSRLDGLVLAPPLSDMTRILRAIEACGTPLARVAPGSGGDRHPVVRTNDREIAAQMTRYLASLGHERIAFITGHEDHKAVANRYLGYEDGMRESRLKLQERLVCAGDNSFKSGERCAMRLLKGRSPPTAIFASNDDMAAGVIRMARQLGLSVPEDLSVAGFDDIPLAQQVCPSLTTVSQPLAEMAELATTMLIDELEGSSGSAGPSCIEASLVFRESTGPAPGSGA
jgi:LacI family transcriptional regulator